MLNSMYIATTSMKLNQKTNDITSNNLANVNTNGFKKEMPIIESFPEVLLAKINDKPDMNQRPFTGVQVENPEEDVYSLRVNSGYFRVLTPGGKSHNREIEFTIDDDGYLKTFFRDAEGNVRVNDENYLIGRNNQPIRVAGRDVNIQANGNIVSNGNVVGNLLIFTGPEIIGTTNAGAKLDKVITDFSDGNVVNTGNKLDFALEGPGFFKVQDGEGNVFYTRDGAFTINANGTLVTKTGMTVLGTNGAINLTGQNVNVDTDGSIFINGELQGQLDIVEIGNKEDLRKIGNSLYRAVENGEIEEQPFTGRVLNEHIESSNVDIIKEMVSMITGFRNYETNQKVINTQDELLGKVVNDLGKI